MPAGLTGTIYIRVVDTDLSWGNTAFDDVFVDEMYIEFESTPGPPVAEFAGSPTSGYAPLTVDFTDLSSGNPDTWSWTFGDGGTSPNQHPSYTYNTAGTYTVTLNVSNAYGSDGETKVDYITVMEMGDFYSHVSNMVLGRTRTGANYKGNCTVTIFDEANAPLANATVYVDYDGPNSGSLSGVTGGDGTVFFETPPFKKPTIEWCFEVTNVTHATHTYDPASNDVTRACESGWVYGEERGAQALGVTRPERFVLYQNNPNPFNPATDISFDLESDCNARLDVYNILGQRMTTLVDDYLPAGKYTFKWNANGEPSGVYFYRLTTDSFVETRKMVLMK
jgi:PKD repeat protein